MGEDHKQLIVFFGGEVLSNDLIIELIVPFYYGTLFADFFLTDFFEQIRKAVFIEIFFDQIDSPE